MYSSAAFFQRFPFRCHAVPVTHLFFFHLRRTCRLLQSLFCSFPVDWPNTSSLVLIKLTTEAIVDFGFLLSRINVAQYVNTSLVREWEQPHWKSVLKHNSGIERCFAIASKSNVLKQNLTNKNHSRVSVNSIKVASVCPNPQLKFLPDWSDCRYVVIMVEKFIITVSLYTNT